MLLAGAALGLHVGAPARSPVSSRAAVTLQAPVAEELTFEERCRRAGVDPKDVPAEPTLMDWVNNMPFAMSKNLARQTLLSQVKDPEPLPEIWDWFFVEKEAPEEWKRMSMRNAVRTFSAAGTFDQDDAEAWAGINLAFRGDVARQEKVNFQAVRAFRDKRIEDFPGPGRIYPSAYGEVTEFEVLLTWKRLMMAQG